MADKSENLRFEPYMGEPDKERLIRAMKRQEVDRVPNVEIVIEDKIVEKLLGRYGGNTLAFGGDPAKGMEGGADIRPMYPKDWIEICKIIGRTQFYWKPYGLHLR